MQGEGERLKALSEYALQPDAMQADLQSLIRLASSLFDVPSSMISVVEGHRTIFAARIGIDVCEIDGDVAFCTHALDRDEPLVILDAAADPRFRDNPLVAGPAGVRFYAGAPLRGPAGFVLGSFCLVDTRPRATFTAQDQERLKLLASLALDKLELRRLDRAQRAGQNRFRQISATSPAAIICTNGTGVIRFWNPAAEAMFGYTVDQAEGRTIDLIVPDRLKGGHVAGMKRVVGGGRPSLVGKSVEVVARRRDGSELPVDLALSMWADDGETSFGAIIRDLSAKKAHEERLYRLAHVDSLTELPNRRVMRENLERLSGGSGAALLLIDLDGFKQVNDILGHSAGDDVLRQVARRIVAVLAEEDVVARMGGDEFAVLIGGGFLRAGTVADDLIKSMSKPFTVDDQTFNLSASVGIALHPIHGENADDLLSAADLALYEAKSEGRHCKRFFTSGLRKHVLAKKTIDGELRAALETGQFELFYQPQVAASTGHVVGAEALIRWHHPVRGLQSPATFLPHLEGTMLAAQVGRWVMEEACRQAARWRATIPGFRIGVNLFGVQFRTGDLVDIVDGALSAASLPPDGLELEITENIILRHDDAMIHPLKQLRERGVGLAFDDYGTGYASLSMLKRYPICRLKIDQSFVRHLCDSAQDAAIVKAVVQLGKAFSLQVVAEGVETEEQWRRLAKGCDELQGFLFGRPMPSKDFDILVGGTKPLLTLVA